jgi:PDZ domain-containing protein
MTNLIPLPHLTIRLGRTGITLDVSWLVIVPLGIWGLAIIYVPILGAFLSPAQSWAVAVLTIFLAIVSLGGHALAHVGAAYATGSEMPPAIPLYPLGDAAQVWPAARSPWREIGVAAAGPLVNVLLAGLAYLVWNAQLDPYLNISMFFLAFFNGGVTVINLTPAFPLDGGRWMRAIVWGLLRRPERTTRLGVRLEFLIVLILVGWAIFLFAQRVRFSMETGSIALGFAILLLLGLGLQPAWEWKRPPAASMPPAGILRTALVGILILLLLAITFSLLPLNNGLEAPGVTPPAGPMVEVPPDHRHPFAGSFLLTTVYPQTPILTGEWIFGQLSPIIRIVPPDQIVPPHTSAQEEARLEYNMLEESQQTAIAVGLRLAGYPVTVEGKGVSVLSIQPDSLAKDVLKPGDIIIGLNGEPIRTIAELSNRLAKQKPDSTVQMQVERNGQKMTVAVQLLPPIQPSGPPRIGIMIESAGFSVQLPFPVKIVPQKIVGGPSAGLMFTLTVYNWVTPEDLTGGRTIAGTGTIDLDGTVGPIGGVRQKVIGAEFAGAQYFLSPPENYADAQSVARHVQVVKVATAAEAIQFLRSIPPLQP